MLVGVLLATTPMRFKTSLLILLLIPVFATPFVSSAYSNPSSSNTDTELLKQLIALVQTLQQQLNELLNQQGSDSSSSGDIKLTSPNGGATYTEGDPLRIKWTPKLPGVSLIELIAEKTTGKSLVLNSYPVTPNTSGVFEKDVTFPFGGYVGKYRIRITTPDGDTDMSDTYFTIKSQTDSFKGPLTITYPNGKEVFAEGQEVGIGWYPNGPLTTTDIVKVELVSTQGEKTVVLCQDSKEDCDDEDGIIYFDMPRPKDEDGGGRYKIKITGEDGQTDVSDNSFTLNAKG